MFWSFDKDKDNLTKFLMDPQSQNSYSYARNNPVINKDPNGEWWKEVIWDNIRTGGHGQSLSSFQAEIGDATQYMGNTWQTAMDHPYATGAVVGVAGGAVVYGAAAGITALSVEYLGSAGTACVAFCDKVDKVTNTISQTPEIVSTQAQKITDIVKGFNHDGSYHGLNQVISRGVSPQMIKNTILNPLGTFVQSNGNIKYVSEQAMIIMNKAGQMVTAWSSNQFNQKSIDLVKSLLQK